MVFVMPVFMWAITMSNVQKRYLSIVIPCLLLVIPLRVLEILYASHGTRFMSAKIFQMVLLPFRSWILLIIFAVMTYTISRTRTMVHGNQQLVLPLTVQR